MFNAFFREMEKRSGVGGMVFPALWAASTSSDIAAKTKEDSFKNQAAIKPLRQSSNYKLGNPNQYQFEGGKHLDATQTQTPNMSIYR